jgi:glycyl-tRNA synthetase beta subunit
MREIVYAELYAHACLLSFTCCRERVPALLSKLRLQHGAVEVHGTPRRLAVLVHDLAAAQTPQESKVRVTIILMEATYIRCWAPLCFLLSVCG